MLEFKYYTSDNRFKFSGQGLYIDLTFFFLFLLSEWFSILFEQNYVYDISKAINKTLNEY